LKNKQKFNAEVLLIDNGR